MLGAGVAWPPGGEKAHLGVIGTGCRGVSGTAGNSTVRLRHGERLQHAAICCGPQTFEAMERRSGGSGTTARGDGDGGNGTVVGWVPGSPVGPAVGHPVGHPVGVVVAVGLGVGACV